MRKQNHTQGQCTGITSTGLTSAGLTSTGLTSTPLLIPNTGRKCRFYWPAQAKPHTRGVIPNTVPHIYGPHIYSAADPKRRSEVSFLLACTSKITHKRSDPKGLTSTRLKDTNLEVLLRSDDSPVGIDSHRHAVGSGFDSWFAINLRDVNHVNGV